MRKVGIGIGISLEILGYGMFIIAKGKFIICMGCFLVAMGLGIVDSTSGGFVLDIAPRYAVMLYSIDVREPANVNLYT